MNIHTRQEKELPCFFFFLLLTGRNSFQNHKLKSKVWPFGLKITSKPVLDTSQSGWEVNKIQPATSLAVPLSLSHTLIKESNLPSVTLNKSRRDERKYSFQIWLTYFVLMCCWIANVDFSAATEELWHGCYLRKNSKIKQMQKKCTASLPKTVAL